MTPRRLGRPALAGGGLVVLLGVVAVAASGRGPGADDAGARSVSSGWIDVVFTLALVGMALTVVMLVAGMRLRREDDTSFGLKQMLVVAAVFVALFGAIALAATFFDGDAAAPAPQSAGGGGNVGPAGPVRLPEDARPTGGRDVGISWPALAAAIAALALLFALTAGRARLARRRRRRREEDAIEAVRAVLQDALDELESGDPRIAVIAAFAGMERTLALHGLPRRPAEAPLEYTERVLEELHASASAAGALAVLFERARFSTHEIDEPDRNEAVRALRAVRDELGAAA